MINRNQLAYIEPMIMDPPFGAFRALYGIKNNLIIYHGAIGCASNMRVIPVWHDFIEPTVPTTYLSEKDVIIGTSTKLYDAILKAFQTYQPSMISVITGSIADVMNEDIEAAVKRARKLINCPVILIESKTFSGDQLDGFIRATNVVIKNLVTKRKKIEEPTINLFGVFSDEFKMIANIEEITRLLSLINVRVMCTYFCNTTLEDIQNSAGSSLNINFTRSPDLNTAIEQVYAVNPIHLDYPFGMMGTAEFLSQISYFLDLPKGSIKSIISIKNSYIKEYGRLAQVASGWQELPIAIFGNYDYTLPLIKFLQNELGFHVKLYVNSSIKLLDDDQLKEVGSSTKIIEHCDTDYLVKILKEYDIRLVLGSSLDSFLAKSNDIPYVNINFPVWEEITLRSKAKPLMGFEGALEICERIFVALNKNPNIKY